MKGRAFAAVVLSALLLLSGLGIGGWWLLWQRGPLQLAHHRLSMPRAARFVPASASFSLYLFSDGQRPVAYARAVAPARQRRTAGEAIARLRDGAFAAAGLDYQDELAGWLGGDIAMALVEDPVAAATGGSSEQQAQGWLLALASRDDDGARRFLQRFWQTRSLAGTGLQVSRYRGMGLISGRGALLGSQAQPLATALVDDDLVLIASGRNLLERALDVSQVPELNQAGQPLLRQGVASFGSGAALMVASPDALQNWLGLPLPENLAALPLVELPGAAASAATGSAASGSPQAAPSVAPSQVVDLEAPRSGRQAPSSARASADPLQAGPGGGLDGEARGPVGGSSGTTAAAPPQRPSIGGRPQAEPSLEPGSSAASSGPSEPEPPRMQVPPPPDAADRRPDQPESMAGRGGLASDAGRPTPTPAATLPSGPAPSSAGGGAAGPEAAGTIAESQSAPSPAEPQAPAGSAPSRSAAPGPASAPPVVAGGATGADADADLPSSEPLPDVAGPLGREPSPVEPPAPASRPWRASWAAQPVQALEPARAVPSAPAVPTLLAVLQPQGRQLELRARLLLPRAPRLTPVQPERAEALLASMRGAAASLALIQDPALLGQEPLLRPLLERSLGLRPEAAAQRQGPLPALLARGLHGPLLASQAPTGWQLASRNGDPAPAELEPLLQEAGLLEAPLAVEGHHLRVWTQLSLPGRGGRRDRGGADALVAPLVGWREEHGDQAWWGQTLAVLEAPAESRSLTALWRGLRELGVPEAPLQWSLDAEGARALLRSWQPWRLLSALAGGGLDAPVRGLALAVESPPEVSALELRARLSLGA